MDLIFDNIVYSLQRSTGMSVYWNELTKRLRLLSGKDTIKDIYLNNWEANILSSDFHFDKNTIFQKNNAKLATLFTTKVNNKNNFILHSSYYRTSLEKNCKNVVTIHDFTPDYFFKNLQKKLHKYRINKAINNANAIICISNSTKKDLLKFYPNIDKKIPIEVIYNGVSDEYFKIDGNVENYSYIKNLGLERNNYILFVGKRAFYKNFQFVLELFNKKLKGNYKLAIVGDKLNQKELQTLQEFNINYVSIVYPSNQELNILYNYAFSLIYPSSYEGFGIPVVEAMKANCPVLALDTSSITEIGTDAAILNSKLDIEEFSTSIKELENDIYRKKIINSGIVRANLFDWNNSAAKVFQFYKSTYNE